MKAVISKTHFVASGISKGLKGSIASVRAGSSVHSGTCFESTRSSFRSQLIAKPSQGKFQARFYSSPATSTSATSSDLATPPASQSEYITDMNTYDDQGSRNYAYFMVGTYSALTAVVAKNLVSNYIVNLAASADVLALAKVELDLASVPEGKNVILKWRGKPVFVRHRTADEIAEAEAVSLDVLRHKETDAERVKKPEWLVMLGVCTHLGCVPIGEAGEYGGWFCPCHGSHYDISGRIRKGPAPLNLEIPEYTIDEAEGKIIIG